MANIKARAKLRTGTLAAWTSANPVLLAGEPGFESDTRRLRIGDGVSVFLALPFIESTAVAVLAGLTASTAELNILDGVTVDAAELNHLEGVSGPIQAQLNAKQAAGATLTSLAGLPLQAGDLFYATGTNTLARLPKGTAKQALTMNDEETAPQWGRAGGYTWLAPQSTASGTEKDFTGIPAWVTEMVVAFSLASLNGTDSFLIQLGDSGGFETTGYDTTTSSSQSTLISTAGGTVSGFTVPVANPANAVRSFATLIRPFGDNEWVYQGSFALGAQYSWSSGVKTLSDVLTQVRITRSGSNTFDLGRVAVGYR